MATFVLIPGAGSDAWYWHLVVPRLAACGHEVVAVDLPSDDDSADFDTYADVVVRAIGDRRELVLVAQSLAGYTAPLVCERVKVELLVLLAAMVPRQGESAGQWWDNTGQAEAMRAHAEAQGLGAIGMDDVEKLFLHDVPPDLAAASAKHVHEQSGTPFEAPWRLAEWPAVPTRFLLCKKDRLFPPDFMRRVVRERLGLVPDEIDCGHLAALARPQELADRLDAYARAR